MRFYFQAFFLFSQIVLGTYGKVLKASSLATCMENSQVTASYFDIEFDPDDGALRYTFDFTSEISGYIYAKVDVYAYGFKIISRDINLCDLGWKQFCPIYPGDVEVDSIEYVSKTYVDMIPGIAYTVPDIDAFVRVKVRNGNGTEVACIQAFFTNGKTVSQTGAKWATAVVAGLGLLCSAVASAFGNSNAASHISANAVSLFLYFQSVVVVSMQHVDEVPPIAAAWAENLAWSMGLIRIHFMQKIFRWYVQSTGGDPTLYLTSSTINILVQRSVDFAESFYEKGAELFKRAAPVVLYGNSNVLIFRGIKRLAYSANIENTSVVCTGFTFFILCAYVLVGLIIFCKSAIELSVRSGWLKSSRFSDFRSDWRTILKGSLARYIYIGFTQLMILSLYEFYVQDSPAVIVLAVLFLILALGTLGWTAYRVITFARISIKQTNNPAAALYGNQRFLDKYGFFYTMFTANKYWWGVVIIAHTLFKAFFIGLGQASGKTQALAFWFVDMAYLGLLIHYKPYLNTPTNIVSILIQLVTTVNSFLFTFFSNVFGQPGAVASIMGWVFFILNAAFSLILLILILVFCGYFIFSKNPDSRFRPAKDDRTSFQRFSQNMGTNAPTAELLALGIAAKDHNDNWESEIHKLQDMNEYSGNSNSTSSNGDDEDKSVPLTDAEKESFADNLFRKLTGNKSFKRTKSKNKSDKALLSDADPAVDSAADVKDGAPNDNSNELDDIFHSDVFHSMDNLNAINNVHKKQESVSSFNHHLGKINTNDVTTTNDFISSDNSNNYSRRSQGLEDEPYTKL